jgi:hypothetical protein
LRSCLSVTGFSQLQCPGTKPLLAPPMGVGLPCPLILLYLPGSQQDSESAHCASQWGRGGTHEHMMLPTSASSAPAKGGKYIW